MEQSLEQNQNNVVSNEQQSQSPNMGENATLYFKYPDIESQSQSPTYLPEDEKTKIRNALEMQIRVESPNGTILGKKDDKNYFVCFNDESVQSLIVEAKATLMDDVFIRFSALAQRYTVSKQSIKNWYERILKHIPDLFVRIGKTKFISVKKLRELEKSLMAQFNEDVKNSKV